MKKILLIILSVAGVPFVALAQSTTTFSLPGSFIGDIWTNVQSIITALGPYITTLIGVILAAVVIEIIIGAIKK